MSETTIDYMDIELVVEYDFEEGEEATRWEPGCDPEAHITSVTVEGVDITAIIGDDHLARISERIAADHEEDALNEHADYLIKQYKELA